MANKIGSGLARAALAAKVDGELVDLSYKIGKSCNLAILIFRDPEGKQIYWHSTAHIMAAAVKSLWPDVKLGIGPAIDSGFYYDFEKKEPFTPEDLKKIEGEMKRIVKENFDFVREDASLEEARDRLAKDGEKFKLQLLTELPAGEKISFYKCGPFSDLCLGPHLPSTGRVKAFKLLNVSAAYWKGDAKNEALQRIYGISFWDKKELKEYLRLKEEAAKRDHRKLGRELDLFSVHEEAGPGLIFFHPNGMVLKSIIENHWIEEHKKRGYVFVQTPHILKAETWKISGHWDYYRDDMFFTKIEEQDYGIKPMNCPGHMLIYKTHSHSYKEFPIKMAELATVYRNELSGVLHGLMWVRGFTQDDAHIFCTPNQVKAEIKKLITFTFELLGSFGLTDYKVYLSTKPKECVGTDDMWSLATDALKQALEELGVAYTLNEGDGAFYGPKIDVKFHDVLGREWQCTTIQADFALPERFKLTYVGEDGKKHRPIMLHRALLGSIERFIAVLLEHYGGAFPLWLSPVQIVVIPVADRHAGYARDVASKMKASGLRVEIDDSQATVEKKVREAKLQKIYYIIVVGNKEVEAGSVTVNDRQGNITNDVSLDKFVADCVEMVRSKRNG